jgi:hypothetical protein
LGTIRTDQSKVFLRAFFIDMLALVGTFGLFNLSVDPYGMFGMPLVQGINANKPELVTHVRLGKAGLVRRVKPKGIILGSSRVEFGLDPKHPGWRTTPVYNLGIPGLNTYELMRFFQHAHSIQPLERVVIGLDMFQFNIWRANREDFEDELLLGGGEGGAVVLFGVAGRVVQMLLSADMFASSLATLTRQDRENMYLRDGSRDQELLRREGVRWGPRRRKFRNGASVARETYDRKHGFRNAGTGVSSFDYFRRILETAHRDSIDLRVFISPPHAWFLESFAAFRAWESREEWKRRLVEVNDEVAANYGNRPFALWDFSGYHAYSLEAVPPWDDNESPMRWYFEAFHYTQELGNLMLDRIFGYSAPGVTDDFGVQLTGNIDVHLATIRDAQRRYRGTYTEDVREMRELHFGSAPIEGFR